MANVLRARLRPNWRWLSKWVQARRRKRDPEFRIVLSSDGHGRLSWWCSEADYGGELLIGFSSDGIAFDDYFDGSIMNDNTRDESGNRGYFRMCRSSEYDGSPVLPYSNAVYSDGL